MNNISFFWVYVGGTRMHYENKARWQMQCYALDKGLLGNLWSCFHVEVTLAWARYLYIVADQGHPFMAIAFPNDSGLFQQHNAPCHTDLAFV